jgi:hypothetical protein
MYICKNECSVHNRDGIGISYGLLRGFDGAVVLESGVHTVEGPERPRDSRDAAVEEDWQWRARLKAVIFGNEKLRRKVGDGLTTWKDHPDEVQE